MKYPIFNIVLFLPLMVLLTGCTPSKNYQFIESQHKPFQPTNFTTGTGESLAEDIKRVVILPMYHEELDEYVLEELDRIFYGELTKQNRFELVTVSRGKLISRVGAAAYNSTSTLPEKLVLFLREEYRAGAVMFVDLTHYFPYRPISMGVRCKLIDLADFKTIWALDELYNSGSPGVRVAMNAYRKAEQRIDYPLDQGFRVTPSPMRFAKYVAFQTFSTLPPKKMH